MVSIKREHCSSHRHIREMDAVSWLEQTQEMSPVYPKKTFLKRIGTILQLEKIPKWAQSFL